MSSRGTLEEFGPRPTLSKGTLPPDPRGVGAKVEGGRGGPRGLLKGPWIFVAALALSPSRPPGPVFLLPPRSEDLAPFPRVPGSVHLPNRSGGGRGDLDLPRRCTKADPAVARHGPRGCSPARSSRRRRRGVALALRRPVFLTAPPGTPRAQGTGHPGVVWRRHPLHPKRRLRVVRELFKSA